MPYFNKVKNKERLEAFLIMRVPKRPVVFYRKLQNFTVVPKRPFVFYSEMQNFENCTQTAIRFFTTKHTILKIATKTVIHVFATKYRILKVVPKRPFVFSTRKYEI